MSLVYLSSSDMYKLINYSSFVNWLAVGISVVALLYFRWQRPNAYRPIKVLVLLTSVCFDRCHNCNFIR